VRALPPDGLRFAISAPKVHSWVLGPLTAGDQPQAPPGLRQAIRTIGHEVSRGSKRPACQPPDLSQPAYESQKPGPGTL